MPQLIIGLDSLGDDANYIHIDDAKEGVNYYCPCCKGLIKPRAYKKDDDYQVQPHFYHMSAGCEEETFVHYICKEWLFIRGSKFIVNEVTYEVESVEIEKTLHTSFGDYRPDIIVFTTSGKIFYFEIKTTNRKTELYAPKWDKLGNDVVEVDTRYFINQKYKNDIPVFDLIYSDGQCHIKSYTRKDYDHIIGTRKIEWKRQDKLNYKIQWERLDWFWNALSKYKKGVSAKEYVIDVFNSMDISDRVWCYQNVNGISCVDIKNELADNINQYYINNLVKLQNIDENISIAITKKSPLIYRIRIEYQIPFDDYQCYIHRIREIKTKKRLFICDIDSIKNDVLHLCNQANDCKKQLNLLKDFTNMWYINAIHPKSHRIAQTEELYLIPFVIEYRDHIHSRYIYESIGLKEYYPFNVKKQLVITEENILFDYKMFKHNAMKNLKTEIQSCVLRNISDLRDFVDDFDDPEDYQLFYHKNKIISMVPNKYLSNLYDKEIVFVLDDKTNLSMVYKTIFGKIYYKNQKRRLLKSVMNKYMTRINQCKNGAWHISNSNSKTCEYTIVLKTLDGMKSETYFHIDEPYSKNSIEHQLCTVMNEIASGLYDDIRLLEVNNGIG